MNDIRVEPRTEHMATEEKPYHFLDSGLPNVYLVGIRYYAYADGRIVPDIPAVKQLMQLIARSLIEQPTPLTGDELRFLRKRLGQKQVDFARAISVEPETISRCENGHQTLGESTDKLVRLYYAIAALDDDHFAKLRKELRDFLAKDQEHTDVSKKKTVATVTNDEWELALA